ncbi:MAG: glycoside hydrolase family 3 C-terminal domain-containing protein [Clostridiales bacterium]|nr:glycoside hydrolase family 3 C-terminal domain-containing protein [Clostridiales bacterium]
MDKYARFRFQPCIPLGKDGRRVTASPEHIALSREASGEGIVLLKNENGALPLRKGEKIALFGKATIAYVKGGGGSGDVHTAFIHNVYDGFSEKEAQGKVSIYMPTVEFYRDYVKEANKKIPTEAEVNAVWDRINPLPFSPEKDRIIYETVASTFMKEADVPEKIVKEAGANAQTAIVTLSRYSAEGVDRRSFGGDYLLSDTEKSLLDNVIRYFDKVIVVVNSGAVIDCEYFAENNKIDALLFGWQGGMEGGSAIADVLCGDVNPSGKLADTIVKSYDAYPSKDDFDECFEYLNYSEDIYVGYRYFETVPGKSGEVRYPFGFGLSYTDFSIGGVMAGESDGKIVVALTVKNTGSVAGKEVVQLYYSAPQGKLGKPSRELAAFKKTKLLNPGESEVIALSFDIGELASFDDLGKIKKSAFVLEKGAYKFYIGNSVRDLTKIDYEYIVEEDRVSLQCSSLCRPFALKKRMLADGSFEDLPTGDPVYMSGKGKHKLSGAKAPETTVMFDDVGEKITLDEFTAQFTVEELMDFVGGRKPTGVANTGCFSGLERLKIPAIPTADGPAGLRLNTETGILTTAWPCSTLLACTWNTDMTYAVGAASASEIRENNIGIWLAPAINIHRNPLCGRNFEYMSEDPVLAGKCAAAEIRGIQSQKVAVSLKHFACNNKEGNRFGCDSRLSERALREIYLKGFEICVKEADPWTLMTSYNLINGQHTSESYELVTCILREEWGFNGMVTTDWGQKNNPVDEVLAGNDMKMDKGYPEDLKAAYDRGKLTRADLEECAKRILIMTLRMAE